MSATSVLDLPTEIFHSEIFKYLKDADIFSFGMAGSRTLNEISEDYLKISKVSINIGLYDAYRLYLLLINYD